MSEIESVLQRLDKVLELELQAISKAFHGHRQAIVDVHKGSQSAEDDTSAEPASTD